MRAMGDMRGGLLAAGLAAVLVAGCGEGAKGGCPATESCGGNPAGTWSVSDVCQFQPVRPAQPVDTTDFTNMTPPLAPTLAPPQPMAVLQQQTVSGDWCSSLDVRPDGHVANAVLWHDAPRLAEGTLTFIEQDHSYVTKLKFSTENVPGGTHFRNLTHFAPRCLMANGGNPTCMQLTEGLKVLYVKAGPFVPETFQQIDCQPATDGGCDCTYIYVVQVDDAGTYRLREDGTLLQESMTITFNGIQAFQQSPARAYQTTMCATPAFLQLSGANGGSLMGLQGLRTLVAGPKPQM
jgi:hypothetical protein